MKDTIRGAAKSKVIWLNTALTVLAGLEMMGSHITTIAGPKVGAGFVMFGALVNIGLRFYTTQSLADKA
jgi:hypothetical protein